jgi:hypothetical protein
MPEDKSRYFSDVSGGRDASSVDGAEHCPTVAAALESVRRLGHLIAIPDTSSAPRVLRAGIRVGMSRAKSFRHDRHD